MAEEENSLHKSNQARKCFQECLLICDRTGKDEDFKLQIVEKLKNSDTVYKNIGLTAEIAKFNELKETVSEIFAGYKEIDDEEVESKASKNRKLLFLSKIDSKLNILKAKLNNSNIPDSLM
mmetsp:Transcript_6005/g.5172  ORF Transcript_6005/g.5172 Transcript_6005/m.5172 type:complete len:121 (+) Transcript_6005:408-770(+)